MAGFHRLLLFPLVFTLGGCAGAGPRAGRGDPQVVHGFDTSHTALDAAGQRAWGEHLAASINPLHQAACAPQRYAPSSKPRGLVVVFHGFSACPDQFDELGPMWAAAGYEVLVPVLPGHGRVQPAAPASEKLVDDVSTTPTRDDWRRYRQFAEAWAEVLSRAQGERVVVGYSLGGALAAMAIAARPGGAERALVIAPFLSISNAFAKVLLGVAEGVDALLTTNPIDPIEHHWGPSCEVERQKGRGGYCSFRVNHVAATQLTGADTRRMLAAAPRLPKLQLVVIDEDDAVDTSLALATFEGVAAKSAQARICKFPRGVPHSFFSPKDRPGEPKPWLPAFKDAAAALVAQGRLFDEGACPGSPL